MIRRFLGTQEQSSEKRSISFQDIFGRGLDLDGPSTSSGELVDYDSAMSLSAVYASIRLLSDTISTLPLDVFYRSQGSEKVFRPLPVWIEQMNMNLANHEVLGQCITSLLLDGNCYIATVRNPSGKVVQITPLDPTTITPSLAVNESGQQVLVFTSSNVTDVTYTTRDITMIRNVMKPGAIEGLSPIKAAREYLGLGLATQKYGGSFFKNSAIPSGIVEVPGQLSPEGVAQMKSAWNDVMQGSSNARKLAILTESAKFSKVSLSPEDSQFLATKEATVADIARLYGLPPHLLADQVKSTSWGSGLHEMNVAMSMYSLRPQVARLESALTSIMRSEGIAVATARFDLASLSRATNEKWGDVYSPALQNGILSINEVRAMEGLPAIKDGDRHYVQLNLAAIGDQENPGGAE
jgi:HK97 family phage portal protein